MSLLPAAVLASMPPYDGPGGLFGAHVLATATGWAVFGVFVALCVVLAGFVVRFARQLHRRGRGPEGPGRDGRRP